LVNSETNFPQM